MGSFKPLLPIGDMMRSKGHRQLKKAGYMISSESQAFRESVCAPFLVRGRCEPLIGFEMGLFTSVKAGIAKALAAGQPDKRADSF
jgi:hypothetical protein